MQHWQYHQVYRPLQFASSPKEVENSHVGDGYSCAAAQLTKDAPRSIKFALVFTEQVLVGLMRESANISMVCTLNDRPSRLELVHPALLKERIHQLNLTSGSVSCQSSSARSSWHRINPKIPRTSRDSSVASTREIIISSFVLFHCSGLRFKE